MSDPDPNAPKDLEHRGPEGEPWDEDRCAGATQAAALKEQARAGGLRFAAYLPPGPALWLLGRIERGDFADPREAVFVLLGEQDELEPHRDLRAELLRRTIEAAGNDSTPAAPLEEVKAEMDAMLQEPRSEPAVWMEVPRLSPAADGTSG